MQNRDIQAMRQEDRQYGEKTKGKTAPYAKPKNQKNLARFSMQELNEMQDDEHFYD